MTFLRMGKALAWFSGKKTWSGLEQSYPGTLRSLFTGKSRSKGTTGHLLRVVGGKGKVFWILLTRLKIVDIMIE